MIESDDPTPEEFELMLRRRLRDFALIEALPLNLYKHFTDETYQWPSH